MSKKKNKMENVSLKLSFGVLSAVKSARPLSVVWRLLPPTPLKSVIWLTFSITFVILLHVGCAFDENEHTDTGFVPVGEWSSGFDSYKITKDTINYFMAGSEWEGMVFPDTILKGNIEKVVDFSNDSGVLIIKVTDATSNTVNKYTGIYYSEYKDSSIKISTAIGPAPDYTPVEADNLIEALSLFTVDNSSTHVSMWGTYTK